MPQVSTLQDRRMGMVSVGSHVPGSSIDLNFYCRAWYLTRQLSASVLMRLHTSLRLLKLLQESPSSYRVATNHQIMNTYIIAAVRSSSSLSYRLNYALHQIRITYLSKSTLDVSLKSSIQEVRQCRCKTVSPPKLRLGTAKRRQLPSTYTVDSGKQTTKQNRAVGG